MVKEDQLRVAFHLQGDLLASYVEVYEFSFLQVRIIIVVILCVFVVLRVIGVFVPSSESSESSSC